MKKSILAILGTMYLGTSLGSEPSFHDPRFITPNNHWSKVISTYVSENPIVLWCVQSTATYTCIASPPTDGRSPPPLIYAKVTFTLTEDPSQHCTYEVDAKYDKNRKGYDFVNTVLMEKTSGIKCQNYRTNDIWEVNQ